MKELVKPTFFEKGYKIDYYSECSGGITTCNKYCDGPRLCPEKRTDGNSSGYVDNDDGVLF